MGIRRRFESWLPWQRRQAREEDLERELRSHLDLEAEEQQEAGLSSEEAAYAARRALGNASQIKEDVRTAWGHQWLETLLQDLRYGLRQLRRNPGFTVVAILTLALGIGANTAIFSLAYSVLLESLPVRNPQRLVVMKGVFQKVPTGYSMDGGALGTTFSFPTYRAIAGEKQALESVFGFAPPGLGKGNLTVDVNGRAGKANGVMVTGSCFSGLGVTAALGRVIEPPDENPGAPRVADIGFGYWNRKFGQSLTVIGKRISINRTLFTIVGVLPHGFTGAEPGNSPDIWIPITANGNLAPWGYIPAKQVFGRGTLAWMTVMGRLKTGVSRSRAAAAASVAFARNIETNFGQDFKPSQMPRLELLPGGKGLDSLRAAFSKPLVVLMVLAGFLLLLASANVAALLLVRGAARQAEIAVRAALGAGRGRLIRQLLTEGVLLAAVGGAAGVAVAYWGMHALEALLASGMSQITFAAGVGAHSLVFLAAFSLFSGVLVGAAPAMRGAAARPISAMKAGGANRGSSRWTGSGLVVAQVAMSLALLAAAGLFVRSLQSIEAESTGINPRHLLLFGINPVGYSEKQAKSLYQQLLERFRALPGVESAAVSGFTMFSGWRSTGDVSFVGYRLKPGQDMEVDYLSVGSGFFRTMGIPLIAGRSIRNSDRGTNPKAVVVNRAFAQRFFGQASPIGQILSGDGASRIPIVGVVADAKYGSPLRKAQATVYLPTGEGYFEVRAHSRALALVPTVRRVLATMAPGVPLTDVQTQSHQIRAWSMRQRLLASLGVFFGLLGLLLSSLGIYGLISFRVVRRTHEIGIRMALGAGKRDVLRTVIGQGLKLALIGVGIGIAGAFALTRFLSSLLYGVKPTDPLTFAVVSLILVVVALFACYIPARRATKVDPMVALRYE